MIYAIWQFIKLLLNVNKTQKKMQRDMEDLHQQSKPSGNTAASKRNDDKGEYIDYEEIK